MDGTSALKLNLDNQCSRQEESSVLPKDIFEYLVQNIKEN